MITVAARPRLVRSARGGLPAPVLRAALAEGGWRCGRVVTTVSDTAVLTVQAAGGTPAVLKLAVSAAGRASLAREQEVLRRLGEAGGPAGWRELLPAPLAAGEAGGAAFLLTSRLPGTDGRRVPAPLAAALTDAAAGAIAPLHRLHQATAEVTGALLAGWVDAPTAALRHAVRRSAAARRAVDRAAGAIRAGLAGAWLPLGWTHGDFHPGNVLVAPDGAVSGIVDWDQASEHGIVAADLAFWLLTAPSHGRRELGARVASRLARRDPWAPAERRLLGSAAGQGTADGGAAARALLLLAWLRHVAGNLAKSDRYASSPLWLWRNVRPVLRQVAHG